MKFQQNIRLSLASLLFKQHSSFISISGPMKALLAGMGERRAVPKAPDCDGCSAGH